MTKHQKISQRQAVYFILTTGFSTIPFLVSQVIAISGRAAWVAEIIGPIILIPLALWVLYLGNFSPGSTILEISEMAVGKIIGRIVSIIYIMISIAVSVIVLNYHVFMTKAFVLYLTPNWIVMVITLGLAGFIASSGIEVQGRLGEVFEIVLIIIFSAGIIIGFSNLFDFANISPVFDQGISPFLESVYFSAGSMAQGILFLMVMVAALPQSSENCTAMIKGLISLSIIQGVSLFAIIGMISAEEGSRLAFGGLNLAYHIQVGKFIHGVEIFVITSYEIFVFINLAANIYSAWVVMVHVINNRYTKVLLVTIVIIIFILAVFFNSYNEAYFYSILLARYITIPFIVLVLLLTSTGVLIRGKRR